MMATERQALAQFIESQGITATAERADDNPNADEFGPGARHWMVTLRRGAASMTVPFSQGSAWTTDPTATDVLESLALDAAGIVNAQDFEDWCAEYGYDTDSRRAERTYNICRAQAEELHAFLGDAYTDLLWNTDRD